MRPSAPVAKVTPGMVVVAPAFQVPGVTVAGGMLFADSGYGVFGGNDVTGNVLLAFSLE